MPSRSGAPRLLTLAASHYCEKARWGLERAGVAYEEECHAPGLHRMVVARHRAGITVPILLTGERRIGGSAAILEYADTIAPPELRVYPEDPADRAEVQALERRYDDVLGPATRLAAYWQVLPHPDVLFALMDHDLPRAERFILRRLTPAVNFAIKTVLGVNEAGNDRAIAQIVEIYTEVATRLDDGRPYLMGERFTAADLAFATMTAPIVWPEPYGSPFPDLDTVPPRMREAVESLRATPAGAFALRVFEEERARVPEPAATAGP